MRLMGRQNRLRKTSGPLRNKAALKLPSFDGYPGKWFMHLKGRVTSREAC